MIHAAELLVVDASAMAALLFGEPDAERVAQRLEGGRLVAPTLMWDEVANVCVKKIKRFPDRADPLRSAFSLLHQMQVEASAVDHVATFDLALRLELTAYDAAYLWLARSLRAPLVTLDRRLGAAAR